MYLSIYSHDKKAHNFAIYDRIIRYMSSPRISLEQWRALVAVVEAGGYAQAAEQMNKSQSTVSYAVAKIEALLDISVFEVQGRKAVLTAAGEVLYRRARLLIDEAAGLERAASDLSQGWEPEIRIAVDHLFPNEILLQVLGQFSDECRQTRVQLHETVLSGNEEALLEAKVDIAITPMVPVGFLGDPLMQIRFLPVAHPDHPLHHLGREVTYQDLKQHRQLVIRDSGTKTNMDAGWLGAEQRWTVSHGATSIKAVSMGLGFAWLPELDVKPALDAGLLKPLPMREGQERFAELYLVFADRDYAGPAVTRIAEMMLEGVRQICSERASQS